MGKLHLGYVNIFVSDLDRAVTFYRDTLGLDLNMADADFGYASFQAGTVGFACAVAGTDQQELIGRHTGVGFIVDDLDATYAELSAKGVAFSMPPERQPWGGYLALFEDPDGNIFYLDPGQS